MKKLLSLLGLLFLVAPALAQTTAVTATITDTDGTVWMNGSWQAQLYYQTPGQTPTINGVPLTPAQLRLTGNLSSGGSFSATLSDNLIVKPTGSQWQFTICPQATYPCSTTTLLVTGASMSLSAPLSAIAMPPRLNPTPLNFAYGDVEVAQTGGIGGAYYNSVLSQIRCWNGASWITCGGGGGGGGNPASPSLSVQWNNSGAFGGDAFFGYDPTLHNLTVPYVNGFPYASRFQTGGGNNGIANYFSAATGFLWTEPNYANTEQVANYRGNSVCTLFGDSSFTSNACGLNWPVGATNHDARNGLIENYWNAIASPWANVTHVSLYGYTQQVNPNIYTVGNVQAFTNYYGTTNSGNAFTNKSQSTTVAEVMSNYAPSQEYVRLTQNFQHALGDTAVEELQDFISGGKSQGGDQGNQYQQNSGISEWPNPFHGTCTTGCTTGATAITVAGGNSNTQQGVGFHLIDVTKAIGTQPEVRGTCLPGTAGCLPPAGGSWNPSGCGSTYSCPQTFVVATGAVGASSAIGFTSAVEPSTQAGWNPAMTYTTNQIVWYADFYWTYTGTCSGAGNVPQPNSSCWTQGATVTIPVVTALGTFAAGATKTCIMQNSINGGIRPEELSATFSGGSLTATMLRQYPSGSFVAQGGACGYDLTLDADTVPSSSSDAACHASSATPRIGLTPTYCSRTGWPLAGSWSDGTFTYAYFWSIYASSPIAEYLPSFHAAAQSGVGSSWTRYAPAGTVVTSGNGMTVSFVADNSSSNCNGSGSGTCVTIKSGSSQFNFWGGLPFNSPQNVGMGNVAGQALIVSDNVGSNSCVNLTTPPIIIDGQNTFSYDLTSTSPSTCTGTSVLGNTLTAELCNCTATLYPYAEVTNVYNWTTNQIDGSLSLSPNAVPFATSDVVAELHWPSMDIQDTYVNFNQYQPPYGGNQRGYGFGGTFSGGASTGFILSNHAALSDYYGFGGTHILPGAAVKINGIWQNDTVLNYAPEGSVFVIPCKALPTNISSPTTGGCTGLDAAYALFTMTTASGQVTTLGFNPNADSAGSQGGNVQFVDVASGAQVEIGANVNNDTTGVGVPGVGARYATDGTGSKVSGQETSGAKGANSDLWAFNQMMTANSFTITSGGSGCSGTVTGTTGIPAGGRAAVCTAVLSGGSAISCTPFDSGSGLTSTSTALSFTGGTCGTYPTGTANASQTQATVQLSQIYQHNPGAACVIQACFNPGGSTWPSVPSGTIGQTNWSVSLNFASAITGTGTNYQFVTHCGGMD